MPEDTNALIDSFRFYTIQDFSIPIGQSWHQPLHRHPESLELLLVIEGSVHCKLNGQSYTACSGTALLVPPGSWHELGYGAAQQQSGYRLCFARNRRAGRVLEAELPPVTPISDLEGFKALFIRLQQETDQPQVDSKQVVQHLIGLILTLLTRSGKPRDSVSSRNTGETIEQVKHFMEENQCRSLTLESLAAQFQLNKFQLARLFKQHTGMSPLQYIISCRMATAKRLLATTDHTVSSVAAACGYKSDTQFQAAFKKTIGITPRHYRLEFK